MVREPDKTKVIADFLEGSRDEESYRRLEVWLASDDSHVHAFVDHLQVEEDLRRLSLHDDMSRYIESRPSSSAQSEVVRTSSNSSWRRFAAMAIAASLLIAAATAITMLPQLSTETGEEKLAEQPPVENTTLSQPPIVATLGNAQDCRWKEMTDGYASGHLFDSASPLHLLSGIAQLTFETGAVLVMQGPCKLDLRENAVALSYGRISAVVPPAASGFTVTTPSSEVIDLGTEFGVDVDALGNSQVHVFSGEVVARARDQAGEAVGEPLFVTTHRAIRFQSGSEEAERFAADEAAFVRWLEGQSDTLVDVSPPIEGRLLLWLRNRHWIVDEDGRVNVWRDTLSPYNRIPDNALQAIPDSRPRVIEDACGGHPAVRFDGIDDCLITTPMTSGDSQTVVFVASIRGRSHEGAQIINYNGPPQLQIWKYPNRLHVNILQIVSRLNREGNACFTPFVFPGFRANQSVRVGMIMPEGEELQALDPPGPGEPLIVVYQYDHDANHAELWINNRSYGSSTAPVSVALTSRKVIGRQGGLPYYFCGDIAEVMIFDEGLGRDRVDVLSRMLAEKYSIQLLP